MHFDVDIQGLRLSEIYVKEAWFEWKAQRLILEEGKAEARMLAPAAYAIRKTALELIEIHGGDPAPVGHPVHSRIGTARISVLYDVDKASSTAVIGPRHSILGASLSAHEFGLWWMGYHYPKRPTMGPALKKNLNKLPAGFAGAIRNT